MTQASANVVPPIVPGLMLSGKGDHVGVYYIEVIDVKVHTAICWWMYADPRRSPIRSSWPLEGMETNIRAGVWKVWDRRAIVRDGL